MSDTGSATPVPGTTTSPILRLDGKCITRTLRQIQMPDEVLAKVREQAEDVLTQVVGVYESQLAPGEVGANGSAQAGAMPDTGENCPTGLLYGRIQSGKTASMIAFTALAIDNGFRVVIVLTSNFVDLVKQTRSRFGRLARTLVHASTDRDRWQADVDIIKKHLPKRGLVLVCAKESRHLQSVFQLLKDVGASDYPAVILDDEADSASPDGNVRKRAKAPNPEEIAATTIHNCINDIRRQLRHHVFLQVTATPYALLLQNVNSPLRPTFTCLLKPGDGYTGGGAFFSPDTVGDFKPGAEKPPIVYVDDAETVSLAKVKTAPTGLAKALSFFLVACAAQALREPKVLAKPQNFLCHTSHKVAEHKKLEVLVRDFIDEFEDDLEPLKGQTKFLVEWAYGELRKTLANETPALEDIVDDILDRLPRRHVRVVNAESNSSPLDGAPNIIIGGNIVGRGLTIDNLLATYYMRKPKVSMMDTMLQHARMFGYRADLMPYTRVFLAPSLAERFAGIHEAEDELRRMLGEHEGVANQVPVAVRGELRATRYGVLDTGSVSVIASGKHLYVRSPLWRQWVSDGVKISNLIAGIFGDDKSNRPERPVYSDVSTALDLLEAFKVPQWDERAIAWVLESFEKVRFDRRSMNRRSDRMPTGALRGQELSMARDDFDIPTFYVLKQERGRHEAPHFNNHDFWYPTLIFPSSMPNYIYNEGEFL